MLHVQVSLLLRGATSAPERKMALPARTRPSLWKKWRKGNSGIWRLLPLLIWRIKYSIVNKYVNGYLVDKCSRMYCLDLHVCNTGNFHVVSRTNCVTVVTFDQFCYQIN